MHGKGEMKMKRNFEMGFMCADAEHIEYVRNISLDMKLTVGLMFQQRQQPQPQ